MQVLFLCCDIGETRALIPVMKELQAKEIDFKVMAIGASIKELKEVDEGSLKFKMIKIKECVDTRNNRAKPLEDVSSAIDCLQPMVVISGPASKAQEQLLKALPAKKKIVYLDNFNYAQSNPSFKTVEGVVSVSQKIVCVSAAVKKQMLQIDTPGLQERNIKPLGRPSLESWVTKVQGFLIRKI